MATYSFRDLLPPYMGHQAWMDMADAIQVVFDDKVEPINRGLKFIRTAHPGDTVVPPGPINSDEEIPPLALKIQNGAMLIPSDFDTFDDVTEMRRLNSLGLHITDPTLIDAESLRRFVQNIALFWYSKGLGDIADFLSFCLNADITMKRLWTTDYANFYEEGSPVIGTPKWKGGDWFLTNHVRFQFNSALYPKVTFKALSALFYDVANYVMVLDAVIDERYTLIALEADPPPASLVVDGTPIAAYPVKLLDAATLIVTSHEI